MSKKIRLGYDILSKRAIETESGVNIDDALRRHDGEISDINNSITDIEGDIVDIREDIDGKIEYVMSKFDHFVVIDPVNGEDANDGLTPLTPVKYLKRAAEVYVEKFGGTKIIAHVINTTCPENYQDSEIWINPGNTSNLFLSDITGVEEVTIINDGGICLSDQDFQTVPGQTSGSAYPKYKLNVVSERSIGLYINVNPFPNSIKAVSNTGDIHINGSYLQDLTCIKLVCQNGSLSSSFGPRFNAMLDVDAEYYFDSKYLMADGTHACGKNCTLISRNTEKNGFNPTSSKNQNGFPTFFISGDLTILSSGSIRETNSGHPTSYVGGKLTIRSLGRDTGSLCLWDIQGHCSDGSGYIIPGDPSINNYPDIDIDWDGDVYFGYFVGMLTNERSRTIANSFRVKCNKFSSLCSFDIFSRSDIIFDLKDGDMNSYSWGGHLYADGTVHIKSENALKCSHKIHADHVDIEGGGTPAYNPAVRFTDGGSNYDANRTWHSDINARITNAIEFFVGSADTYTTSTYQARYSVKCTGDYCDYNYSFQNGNAIVSLDVDGSATVSYNSSMVVKRLVLRSDRAYFTNGGVYASSFDIKSSKIQVQNGGRLYQWFSYGSGGWEIGYKNNGTVTNGSGWSNNEEDLSIVECDTLEFLNPSFYQGWIRPAYSVVHGTVLKHDWNIRIGTLIPYRVTDTYYSGGNEYCSIIGQPYQGEPNSAIMGTIGDVMIGNGQFVSEFKHDWFIYSGDRSYYENYSWNGSIITCRFLKEISHNVYIDFDQGNDAYDGLSRETPVRSMYGLRQTCNRLYRDPPYDYVLTIHVMSSQSGRYDATSLSYGPYNSLDFNSNSSRNSRNSGLLYNWYAAKYLNDNKSTLLPEGWRVPTYSDMNNLYSNGGNNGVDLRSKDWTGNDKYGLDFMKVGYGYSTSFYVIGDGDYASWSSDEYNSSQGRVLRLGRSYGHTSSTTKTYYYPIRLVRTADASAETGTTGTVTIGGDSYNTVVVDGLEWITRNLDYKFSGGTFRDGTTDNTIDGTTTPQYAYWQYNSSGWYNIPFGYCQYVEIVSEKPYLSIFIDSLNAGVCKITGFRNIYMLDPRISCLNMEASEDIEYCCGNRGKYGHDQPEEYYPNVLVSHSRNFYGRGFHSASSTYIDAYEEFQCRSGGTLGSGAVPYFSGDIKVNAKDISIGDQCALLQNMNAVFEATNCINMSSPPTVQYGTLKLISHTSDSTSYYFQSINCANILIDAPNSYVNISYLGYAGNTSGYGTTYSGGTFRVNCREFYLSSFNIYNSDVFINASKRIYFGNSSIYGDNSSKIELSALEVTPPTIYGGQYTIKATTLYTTRIGKSTSYTRTGNTEVYIDALYAYGPVFNVLDEDLSGMYFLEAKIGDLSGKFIQNSISSATTYRGSHFMKVKGVVDFYTGNVPDTDLADWRDSTAPDADFELIVLNRTKQLVAGQGISIADTGDEIVISSDPKSTIVQRPVTIENGTATVSLILNKYNIITGIDSTVTDLVIDFPVESTATLLTEIGFEFYLDAFSQTLNSVTFANSTEQLSSIVPDEFTPEHIYQGVLVNRCITLVEYDRPDINVLEINGKKYRTVKIGNQTWMAENLADASSGVWYDNDQATYEPLGYGKLYTYTESVAIANSVPGWHLPTLGDSVNLENACGGAQLQGRVLKSTTGWNSDGNGEDTFGFNAKPSGYGSGVDGGTQQYYSNGYTFALMTSILANEGEMVNVMTLNYDSDSSSGMGMSTSSNIARASVRLVKDMSVNIGGRDYKVVKIGNQLWMAENLDWKFNTLNFRDSSNNPLDTTTAIQAAYFNYDEATYGVNGNKYGLLYNWYAVDYLNNHLSELGVPSGWHVSTRAEWNALVSAVGENPGTKLKSTTGWSSGAGTDDYGFSAVSAGRWYNNRFSYVGSYAHFWTSEPNGSYAWYRYIDTGTSVYESSNSQFSGFCYSVRLVKDSN